MRKSRIATVVLASACAAAASHAAVLVPENLDVAGLRPALPGQGLLVSKVNPFAGNRWGHEFSGWVDVRSPALNGPRSAFLGFDRTERVLSTETTILRDNANVVAQADLVTDMNHANTAFLRQAGVTVLERGSRQFNSPVRGAAGSFDFPLTHGLGGPPPAGQQGLPMEEQAIMANNLGGGARINTYYAQSLRSNAFAETYHPSFTAGLNNEALFMANKPVNGPRNTFAHELTHFITDGRAIHMQNAADVAHSDDPRNLVGVPQYDPGQAKNALGVNSPPWDIPDNDEIVGPVMATADGTANGAPRVGGISRLERTQLYSDPGGGAANRLGLFGDPDVQPYLAKGVNDKAGDRVDWNYLVDDWITEDVLGGADHYAGGRESLYFGIGTSVVPADEAPTADNGGKDKTGLGAFNNPGFYQGAAFRYADIFSISARFGDYDVNDAGLRSLRADSLDYDVRFVTTDNQIVNGVPVAVYTEGWTDNSFADDYLARWMSPADAIGVLITAHRYTDLLTGAAIGNTHIDAVIVSSVIPEPGALAAIGALAALARRRR